MNGLEKEHGATERWAATKLKIMKRKVKSILFCYINIKNNFKKIKKIILF
jgi:hypothetical protein